jgi:hypothetical protein
MTLLKVEQYAASEYLKWRGEDATVHEDGSVEFRHKPSRFETTEYLAYRDKFRTVEALCVAEIVAERLALKSCGLAEKRFQEFHSLVGVTREGEFFGYATYKHAMAPIVTDDFVKTCKRNVERDSAAPAD